MKQWQETSQIVGRLTRLDPKDGRPALATVVSIAGSSYRRPGAKLLIEPTGDQLGGVSGGCLEADVREIARRVIGERKGQPVLKHYDTSTDQDALWGLGLGCNGEIDVFIQEVTPGVQDVLHCVGELLDGDSPFAISTILAGPAAGDVIVSTEGGVTCSCSASGELERGAEGVARVRLAAGESGSDRIGAVEVFTEIMKPPPALVIVGAGDDARALAALGQTVGFRVVVVDHRAGLATPERFPEATRVVVARFNDPIEIVLGDDSYVVVMTHSLVNDRGWVELLLRTSVPYVGVLGPRARTEEILEEITGSPRHPRVFGPVGMDIGSDGPEQVAVSIIAETLSVRARALGHPRLRKKAAHAS